MTSPTTKFAAALSSVLPLTTKRTSLPCLNCVLVSAKDGQCSISGTDLVSYARAYCECDGDLEPMLIPAYALKAAVWGDDTLEISPENSGRTTVKCGSNVTIPVQDAKQFPEWPGDKLKRIGVNTEDLANLIESVMWAPQRKDEAQVFKTTVSVKSNGKCLDVAGGDGYVFGFQKFDAIAAAFTALFPCETADSIIQALRGENSVFLLSENWIGVKSDGFDVFTKQVEGKYPDMTKAITSREPQPIGKLKLAPLIETLEQISALAQMEPDHYMISSLVFSEHGIAVSTHNSKTNTLARALIGKFKEATLHANTAYLLRVLKSVKADECQLEIGKTMMVLRDGSYTAVCLGLNVE